VLILLQLPFCFFCGFACFRLPSPFATAAAAEDAAAAEEEEAAAASSSSCTTTGSAARTMLVMALTSNTVLVSVSPLGPLVVVDMMIGLGVINTYVRGN
jgi:hypothetical protein